MAKRLLVLVGMLAVLLAAAVPAFAQEASPTPMGEEVAVTGVVEIVATDGATDNDYGIVDEASGAGFFLKGDANFGALEGQRVTAYGVEDPESAQRTLNVSRIESADAPSRFPPGTVVATFELAVKGEVPAGTEFFGIIGSPEIATGLLMDQDGDGVYTVSLPVERGTEQEVRIERADPISDDPMAPLALSTFKDFGPVKFDADKTFRAKVNFKKDRGEDDTETPEETTPTTPNPGSGSSDGDGSKGDGSGDRPDLTAPENGIDLNEDGSTDGADGKTAAATSDAAMEAHQTSGGRSLPATGGASALPIAGVAGALLVVGGLLVRRLSR